MTTSPASRRLSRGGVIAALALFGWIFSAGCAPEPRNVPCTNDGQCEKASEEFRYCLQSRCVECIEDSACGDGNACVSGECQVRCTDDRKCTGGEVCREGTCARP